MATIIKRGEAEDNFVTFVTATLATGIVAGHRAIVACFANKDPDHASEGISSISDSASNTWGAADEKEFFSVCGAALYSCHLTNSIANGGTITVTFNGSSGWQILVYDLDSSVASGGVEANGSKQNPATTTMDVTALSAMTTPGSVFAFFCYPVGTTTSGTYPSGYTGLDTEVDYAANKRGQTSWKRQVSGTPTASTTLDSATDSVGLIVSYKEAGTPITGLRPAICL